MCETKGPCWSAQRRLSTGVPGEVVNNSCRDPAPTKNGSPVCSLSLCGSSFNGVSNHLLFLQPCVVPGASVQADELICELFIRAPERDTGCRLCVSGYLGVGDVLGCSSSHRGACVPSPPAAAAGSPGRAWRCSMLGTPGSAGLQPPSGSRLTSLPGAGEADGILPWRCPPPS